MIDSGSTIGPYKVIKRLGEGGMGAVFQAVNEAIERQVAIKVLHPEFAKVPEFTARFFNEARAVNRIEHPGVVQIGDYGQLPDGTAYIVMEYLRGDSLADRIEKANGPLGLAVTLNFGRQLAETLTAAHGKGIIHRDLKPDNVIVVSDSGAPGGERTKLLDFGIAKLTNDANAAGVKTRTSAVMGTPHFMSPEQCKGGKNVDEKSDVYAFGVLLFVMLTGRYPFDGDGVGDIMGKHLFEPPPSVKSVVPETPDAVAQLVNQLLAKSKDERPTMAEVEKCLASLSHNAPALPTVNKTQSETGRPSAIGITTIAPPTGARRRRLTLIVSAGVFVIGMLVAALVLLRGTNSARTPTEAQDAAAARSVHFRIESTPPGAEVIRLSDGSVLGTTPWETTREAALGQLAVKLRLAGYAERVLTLDLGAENLRSEVLIATAAASAGSTVPPTETAPAGSSKKGKKGKPAKAESVPPGGRRFEEE